jgi:hypothetical protein
MKSLLSFLFDSEILKIWPCHIYTNTKYNFRYLRHKDRVKLINFWQLIQTNVLWKMKYCDISVKKSVTATENDERVDGWERHRGCGGEGWRNEKLITSSIKIAMIHHDVWTGCSSRLIKGRMGKLSGETKFNYLRNHIYIYIYIVLYMSTASRCLAWF